MSVAAYRNTLRESDSPRHIERRLLAEAAARIEAFAPAFDGDSARTARLSILASGLREALVRNQSLWAALRLDLAEAGNGLAPALRAQLISISAWVDRQTTAALRGRDSVGPLVEVNRAIVDGLSARPAQPATEAQAAASVSLAT
ncbi:flagellar biosynthesis regulator FlaF [Pseudoroseicyclus aestuarii]|uniref:Flagellar protein FlaF n=1 Tax=Pseudoroseicyclus aestuarii TaxID=1795041 RepID=A0A318SS61_9RHOB|nr:flagellar biosynthesis regulator FlaF [Pseudoroseicyclus aestuarii]PYE84382.1 flagellar protein FlaF [Pseudoroseicyclus aestuarii]